MKMVTWNITLLEQSIKISRQEQKHTLFVAHITHTLEYAQFEGCCDGLCIHLKSAASTREYIEVTLCLHPKARSPVFDQIIQYLALLRLNPTNIFSAMLFGMGLKVQFYLLIGDQWVIRS